jgi:hypothetical protein
MKNLEAYQEDCFDFHQEAIDNKNTTQADPTYKQRVRQLNPIVRIQYDELNEIYNDNAALEEIESHGFGGQERDDLKKLYSYDSNLIQELKIHLTTINGAKYSTCPNCTISEINSFDHYLPKGSFSEFVVNPKNLIPCCQTCNSIKGDIWKRDGKRVFLNLYLDRLPETQYLFVDFIINEEGIETNFYLNNPNDIENDLFSLIESHYRGLNLLERFSENSDEVITEFINSIKPCTERLTIEEIREVVDEGCEENNATFGFNYWKSILKSELINNENFVNEFIT